MLQNAYFLAKIGADTAENEQHFAEILPTDGADGRRLELVTKPAESPVRPQLCARGATSAAAALQPAVKPAVTGS